MNLAPTYQIHPATFLDPFQSSLSKFHGSRLLFLRQSSSNILKKRHFFSPNSTCSMNAPHQHNPARKSNFPVEKHRNSLSCASETAISQSHPVGGSSCRSWIDKWRETRPLNLPKKPKAVVDFRNGAASSEDDEPCSDSGNGSRRSSNTMDRIVEKLKRFGYVDDMIERKEKLPEKGSVDDIFYAEDGILPNSRGGISGESQLGMELDCFGDGEVRFPWEKKKEEQMGGELTRKRLRSKTAMAELTLPESELRRLRNLAIRMKSRTKIGGMGVTQAVVDDIHEKWKSTEVVRLKFEGASALNMRRTHEILEVYIFGILADLREQF
ncbi:Chloroplastic group IIA intron splicing facilitator CRS1 [Asimina triloba]